MAVTGNVQALFSDREKTNVIFPITKTSAVSNDEGVGLDALMENMAYCGYNTTADTIPLNADTLGGRLPSEYALAKYGLGLTTGELNFFNTPEQVNALTKAGWYEFYSSKNYCCDGQWGTSYGGILVVPSMNCITQFFFCRAHYGCYLKRISDEDGSGVWQPWEWVNPPMELGVEYRTTERCNGKAVYVKIVESDTLPEEFFLRMETGIPISAAIISYETALINGSDDIFEMNNSASTGGNPETTPHISSRMTPPYYDEEEGWVIHFDVDIDMSYWFAQTTIKYIK